MQAPFEMTEGRARLSAILDAFPTNSPHWNEAQNRFQFVDRLLTECLGWERPNIEVESRGADGGIADYVLGDPAKAILEAKREAVVFKALPDTSNRRARKLRPLIEACPAFADAVQQVIPYCALEGAQIGIVCNGPQLAIFQAIAIGSSPLDGECFLFNGFTSYKDDFPLLWTLLSPEGVAENQAYRRLAEHRNPRIPPKASASIPDPTGYRYRNPFQENLRQLSSILLEEIEDNPALTTAFYRDCYVPLEANNRHLLLSKRIIAARYARATGDSSSPSALEGLTRVNEEGELELGSAAFAGAGSSRPIVVIGDVGVGKSSFFQNLQQGLATSEDAETYFLNINLGLKANLAASLKDYVLSEIPRVLKSDYDVDIDAADFVNAIYHLDLLDFDKSVKGQLKTINEPAYQMERINFLASKVEQRDRHLHASLRHLAQGRDKRIVLVLDNADQRNFEIQQDAFLIAQELAATRNVLVFVALRPSTFFLSKTTGALAAYQNRVFTISPPPADEVIQRRLTFALRVAEGKVAPQALANVRLQLANVVAFLQATLRSIRTNESIRQFLSNITGGNTRAVIELTQAFFGSPNVDSRKIVQIESEQGNYVVPLHEFTKHALLGEYAYFNAHSSQVACNLFDVSAADPREHFLASLIVGFLSAVNVSADKDGYVPGEKIIAEMMRHGFVEDQIRLALRRLATKRLIETPHGHFRELPVQESLVAEDFPFRVTSIGIYHIRHWTGSFGYLDAVAIDTPIFDQDVRDVITRLAPSFDIADRLKKAEAFRNYLEAQWDIASLQAGYYDFNGFVALQRGSFDTVRRVGKGGKKTRGPRRR
jgi:predicted type IV restriction endonuclease